MTREQSIAKMAELENEVDALVTKYNEALGEGTIAELTEIDEATTEKLNEYTSVARTLCFMECKDTADPMLEAVRRLTYQTIAVKDIKAGDDALPVREKVNRDKPIDLKKLNNFCKGGIGHDKKWLPMIEAFNMALTCRTAVELGVNPKGINNSYEMSKLAKEIDLGKNPVSNTKLLATLNTVIAAMLGDGYKANSHDVAYLLKVYAKKGRTALTVVCANHRFMTQYMAEIAHRIVTGAHYEVEYKKIKGAVSDNKSETADAPAADAPAADAPAADAPAADAPTAEVSEEKAA